MDHDEVREELELAAAEPEGIDRLMAGDTPTAQAVAGHVAGCPACAEELVRLRRAAGLIRETVRSIPPPDLRDRTLAYVREYGRVPGSAVPAGEPTPLSVAPGGAPARAGTARTGGTRRLGWIAAVAAAAIVSIVATSVVLEGRFEERLARSDAAAQGLARVTAATVALGVEPDATRVELAEAGGATNAGPLAGTLLFSPSSAELVVIATGLTEPTGDREYRCWVEIDGVRSPVGKMFFGGELAYWAGRVDAVEGLRPGSTFGVSLVDVSSEALDTEPVLEGRVGG
jgi:hypothetical protein